MLKSKFIQISAVIFFLGVIILAIFIIFNREKAVRQQADVASLKLASFFDSVDNNYVKCNLCPNRCLLAPEQTGLCKARKNIGGKLYSLVYGKVAAVHNDPIEKKPLYHFLPGSTAYSIATTGCNMSCSFCQNWDISQKFTDQVQSRDMIPEQVVNEALQSGSKSIAYTYSEPTIFYEFMLATAKLAQEKGLKNVMHSNGYINQEPLLELIPYLDAANIDLKGMTDKYYSDYTLNGKVGPVLETLKTLKQKAVWLEITNLLIPGANDSQEEIEQLTSWIRDNLGVETPLHFSRFFPLYKLENLIPTPLATMQQAYEMAKKNGLKYVYIGNIESDRGNNTFCSDGQLAIKRLGYFVMENNLVDGKCANGEAVAGVWQ